MGQTRGWRMKEILIRCVYLLSAQFICSRCIHLLKGDARVCAALWQHQHRTERRRRPQAAFNFSSHGSGQQKVAFVCRVVVLWPASITARQRPGELREIDKEAFPNVSAAFSNAPLCSISSE